MEKKLNIIENKIYIFEAAYLLKSTYPLPCYQPM